jgi:TPR repeat protein
VTRDAGKAFKMYLEVANAGDPAAMYQVGAMYYEGDTVEADSTIAFGWFLKSANGEDVDGLYMAGSMYFEGEGVKKDTAKGEALLKQAATAGSEKARTFLDKHQAATVP